MEEPASPAPRSEPGFAASVSLGLKRGWRLLADAVLPPRCLLCGQSVGEPEALCGDCWRGMRFFTPPWCARCGLPFPYPMGEGALCGECSQTPPAFDRARAVLRYDERSRPLVLAFKHADETHLAGALGRWMRRAGAEVLEGADLLFPVPLHWTRLFRRRYNQAALLAHAVRACGGPPVAPDWLLRRRRTPSQGRMGRSLRERNVRGAFLLRPGKSVKGRRVVLVDDVMTTGATVEECARVLRKAGAEFIGVLTLARAVRSGP